MAKIQVRFLCEGVESVGEVRNVSRAGMFVATADAPRPGLPVALQFRPPEGPLVDLRGEVRWNTEGCSDADIPSGFGVMLHEPPAEFRTFYGWAVGEGEAEKSDSPV